MGALRAAVDRYLDKLRIERGYAHGTLDNYARSLARLAERAESLGLSAWSQLRAEPARVLLSVLGILLALALVALPVVLLRG